MAVLVLLVAGASTAFAADTDSDGLTDAAESGVLGTNPSNADTDGDGIDDFTEIFVRGSKPCASDTDGDGIADGSEVELAILYPPSGDLDGVTAATFTGANTTPRNAASGETPYDGVGANVSCGEVVFTSAVAGAKGIRGIDHVLGLRYESQSAWDGYWGKNWVSILDAYASIDSSNTIHVFNLGHAEVQFPQVSPGTWTWNPKYQWIPAIDVGNILVKTRNGGEWTFAPGNGYRISSYRDRFGNTQTYNYTSGALSSITDSRGESHTIELYSATGRVKKVTLADGAEWKFEYNVAGQLFRITGPVTATFGSGIVQEFAYTNGLATASLNDNLIAAWDGKGQDWLRCQYDTSDRVSKQTVGGGDFVFDYTNFSSQETKVTDRAGNERIWKWDASKLTKTELTEKTNRGVRSGEGDYTTTWTHDADGYLLTTTYPRGNGVKRTLNAQKQPTSVRRKTDMTAADSAFDDLIDAYTYENSTKFYALATHTDPNNKTTTYTNDSYGQPTQIDHPTLTHVSPNVTVTEYRSYNANGTLASTTDGEGKVTTYTYYTTGAKKGRVSSIEVDDGGLSLLTQYDYEAWGDLKQVTDPRGNVTSYQVERYGNVTKITYPAALGYETKFTHDANLNVTKREIKNIDYDGTALTTPSWLTTNFVYTSMDELQTMSEQYASGPSLFRTTEYNFDANDNVSRIVRDSREVRFTYDERDLLYQRTLENASNDSVWELTYDGNRNTTVERNPRNKDTTHTYDLFDRRTKTVNALGHYVETVWCKCGHVTETKAYEEAGATDVLKAHHKTTYDNMGRPWKEEDLLQGSPDTWPARTVVYDKRSLVVKMTDRRSYDTEIAYDGAGRRISAEDALGNLTEWDYDANGNVTTLTETEVIPGGGTEAFETTFEYDAINRMKKRTVIDRTNGSNTKVTEWKRDALGVVRKEIDPKTWETTRDRDWLGRITEERRDMGSSAEIVTSYEYNLSDQVTKLTDDNGSDTVYAYDALGRLETKTYENTKTVSYAYDKNNNVTSITDQNGSIFAQTFDDLDRMTARDITPASGVGGDTDEDFAYDALNRLTEAKDNDSIVQFTYDSLSRVLTEVQGDNPLAASGKTTSYTYDAEGNRTKIDYPSGFDANEVRDALGRISSITDGSSTTLASFDLYGSSLRKKKTTFGNTTTANFSYDGFRRPTEIAHKTSTPTTFASFEYGWDKNDNPTYEARSHQSGKGDVYSYDRANRLINVKTDCDDPAAEVASPGTEVYVKKLEYDMDDVFNLTAYKVTPYGGSTTTTSYTTNAMNEYTAIGGTSLSYTDAGSLEDDGTYEYEYDAHQHLIRVILKSNSSTVATYKYDALGLGRRIKKTVGSDVTRYVYAGQQSIEEYDGSGNLARLFVFGERIDDVLMMESPDHADVDGDSNTTETVRLTYHSQLIGSVTHVTAPNQAVVESYLYDPYGKVTMKNAGGSTIGASAIKNPYLYTGRQLDEETGLYYYRARHYSAEMRRFIQRDTLEYVQGANALAFCRSAPIVATDPSGLTASHVASVNQSIDRPTSFFGSGLGMQGMLAFMPMKDVASPLDDGRQVAVLLQVSTAGLLPLCQEAPVPEDRYACPHAAVECQYNECAGHTNHGPPTMKLTGALPQVTSEVAGGLSGLVGQALTGGRWAVKEAYYVCVWPARFHWAHEHRCTACDTSLFFDYGERAGYIEGDHYTRTLRRYLPDHNFREIPDISPDDPRDVGDDLPDGESWSRQERLEEGYEPNDGYDPEE